MATGALRRPVGHEDRLSLIEHLDELRSRLIVSALALVKSLPQITGNRPVTLGIGEPFTNTMIVSLYFAILLAMPFLLWQAYAFILPAFSPTERQLALPLLVMIPFLFLAGVAFGYFF